MTDWQRLSPWGVVFFVLLKLRPLAQAVPGILAAGVLGTRYDLKTVLIIAAVIIPIWLIAAASLSWWRYTFLLRPGRLEVRQGLFFRKHLELPAERVQNIEVNQPLYYKPLGLYNLKVQTAGASGDEAQLAAMTQAGVEHLRQTLLNEQHTQPETATTAPQPSLLKRSVSDLLIFGLCHNHLTWVLVGLAPFYDNIGKFIGPWLKTEIDHAGAAVMAVGFVVAVVLLSLLSMLAAVLIYHPYRLDAEDEKLRQSGGIINQRQLAMRRARLQWLSIRQNLLDRLFGRWQLTMQPVRDNQHQRQGKTKGASQSLLAPSLRPHELPGLIALAGDTQLRQTGYSRPARSYLRLLLLWWSLLTLPLAALLSSRVGSPGWLLLLLPPLLSYLHYLGCGWQRYGNRLWLRRGIFSRKYWLLLPNKTQAVSLRQSPGQRRRQLATLTISFAAGQRTIPYLPLAEAQQLRDWLLASAQRQPGDWL
ncbi:PH domain-containing protein [Gallaecimonas sp. GXIMD1310]|uniref:PH domain-containing protein n=1 Tax=Gallaecimonas sp. GXIMD1310 TaxID=3131926 RepID=UPI003252589A